MKNIEQYTKTELEQMEPFMPDKPFDCVVIVTRRKVHDSGFRCMKFILVDENEKIVGVVGGGSDVIHINGFGGYGKREDAWRTKTMPVYSWRMDCLKKSGCLRLWCGKELELSPWCHGGSDFGFEVK